ncbi:MAG: dipeptidase [Candidatus Sericytochromatia bacterium]
MSDAMTLARLLDISPEALALYQDSEVIDLHTDTFLWQRLLGYRPERRHRPGFWGAPFGNQVDLPRAREAGMAGVVWDIVTNPLEPRARKYGALRRHLSNMLSSFRAAGPEFAHVVSYADYQRARTAGQMACWISLQGGQALDNNLHDLGRIPEVHRITLVHFTRSRIGASNFDRLNARQGLSPFGKSFVERMVAERLLVDLAHINERGFYDALDVMPPEVPPIVTHTGVKGVCNIWRNLDDAQIKAIAARNGTIGVIYERHFLARERSQQRLERIIDHMAHIIAVAGEDYVSLGSDYDGMITLPPDFKDITWQPVLVERMLARGWSETRIRKILAHNFLRVVQAVRPV